MTEEQTLGTSQETQSKADVLSQKDAVRGFIMEALTPETQTEAGGPALRDLVTKEIRKAVRVRLFAGMKDGTIKLKRPMDDSKLKKYCSSLINNWLKKDNRLG